MFAKNITTIISFIPKKKDQALSANTKVPMFKGQRSKQTGKLLSAVYFHSIKKVTVN